MNDTRSTWTSFAQRVRRRWTSRRVRRAHTDFVWVRARHCTIVQRLTTPRSPLAVNLSLQVAFVHDAGRSTRQLRTPPRRVALHAIRLGSAAHLINLRSSSAAHEFHRRTTEGRHPGTDAPGAPPRFGFAARTQLTASGMATGSVAALHARSSAVDPRSIRVATQVRAAQRVERRVAPPPMVSRSTERAAQHAVPVVSMTPSPAPQMTMGHWSPATAPARAVLSPIDLASVTDHVVRHINDRVRAKRERLGKV